MSTNVKDSSPDANIIASEWDKSNEPQHSQPENIDIGAEKSTQKENGLSHHKKSKQGNLLEEDRHGSERQENPHKVQNAISKGKETGSQWTFLDTVPNFMKCKICCDVFESPQLLSCCGTNVCKKCMESHLQRLAILADQQPSCPFCRSTKFELIHNAALEHSINQLKVQCHYQHKGCHWTGALQNGNLHLKECDFMPIDCPNRCGCEQFERCKFSDHMLICPHTHTTCSFGSIGCDVKMPLLSPAAKKHASDCLSNHLLLVAQKNAELLKDFRQFCTTIQSEDCRRSVTNDEYCIESQREALATTKHTIKSLKENLQETQKKTATLKSELRKEEICLAEIKRRVTQTKNIEATCQEGIVQIQTLPVPEVTGLLHPPITFTIDNFKKRIKLKGINIMWLSPPFYTHVGGYKMCLSLQPERSFISVSIHLLAGEFDEHLTWPLPGAIFTITAINQRPNKCNRSVNLRLDGEDNLCFRLRQMDGGLGFGFGAPDFLLHSDLSGFLSRDDCFNIKVYRIQFLP